MLSTKLLFYCPTGLVVADSFFSCCCSYNLYTNLEHHHSSRPKTWVFSGQILSHRPWSKSHNGAGCRRHPVTHQVDHLVICQAQQPQKKDVPRGTRPGARTWPGAGTCGPAAPRGHRRGRPPASWRRLRDEPRDRARAGAGPHDPALAGRRRRRWDGRAWQHQRLRRLFPTGRHDGRGGDGDSPPRRPPAHARYRLPRRVAWVTRHWQRGPAGVLVSQTSQPGQGRKADPAEGKPLSGRN